MKIQKKYLKFMHLLAAFSMLSLAAASLCYVRISLSKGASSQSAYASKQKQSRIIPISYSRSLAMPAKQKILFEVSVTPENTDINRGDFLKIKVICRNLSDKSISPKIILTIMTADEGENVYFAKFPWPENRLEIPPKTALEMPELKIPTSNIESGKYKARLHISQGNRYTIQKEFDFSIGIVKSSSSEEKITESGSNTPGVYKSMLAKAATAIFLILGINIYERSGKTQRTKNNKTIG